MRKIYLIVSLLSFFCSIYADGHKVTLYKESTGRIYEGLGTLSAGASSALLIDYPEPYRSDILDLLFSPDYGASFQHLKIEIGSGVNSTCGSEPSHAITCEELADPKPRGYELWLASEARKRNPNIILDALPWGTPAWTTNYTTQEAADWVVAFLDVAKKYYGLDFQYVGGCQNEQSMLLKHPNSLKVREFITKYLRPTLDLNGYKDVQIVASDFYNGHIDEKYKWSVAKDVMEYPDFGNTLDVVGYHYPVGYLTDYLDDRPLPKGFLNTGKRIWASEDYSCTGGDFDKGWTYVWNMIREYNELGITKSISWAPLGAMPKESHGWWNVGFISAPEPWSGHYNIFPALWCIAHISQFVKPGWQYMDCAQGQIDNDIKGTNYMALKAPNQKDWSMIIATVKPETMEIYVDPKMSRNTVYVWKSDKTSQMKKVSSIEPIEGVIKIALEENSIYTLTTTSGQQKGKPKHTIPISANPSSWKDDFQTYNIHDKPKYWIDQAGTFEIVSYEGSNVLKQIVPQIGSTWHVKSPDSCCFSRYGGCNATNRFTIKVEAKLIDGYVEVGTSKDTSKQFSFKLHKDGKWSLDLMDENLANGILSGLDTSEWHTLSFSINGSLKDKPDLKCIINNQVVYNGSCKKEFKSKIFPMIGCNYSPNLFKQVEILL